jgi:lambda repressor-like predicted transcriptional regulator
MKQEKLRLILREKGISVNKLALECKITSPDMYSALNGKKPMFPKWRKAISEYLGMTEDELFEKEG